PCAGSPATAPWIVRPYGWSSSRARPTRPPPGARRLRSSMRSSPTPASRRASLPNNRVRSNVPWARRAASSTGARRTEGETMFKAIYLEKSESAGFSAGIRELDEADLVANTGDADVDLDVEYSTINFKDGLAISNSSPVVRKW